MDVLIKNMELPKETQCCYTIYPNGKVIVHWDGKVLGEAKAIELPPHGYLGDLSELSMTLYSELETQTPKTLGEVMQIIKKVFDEAPTVLEASTITTEQIEKMTRLAKGSTSWFAESRMEAST